MAKKNETRTVADSEERSEGHASGTVESTTVAGVTTTISKTTSGPPSRPVRTFRLKGVKASVFENKTEQGAYHKVSLQRVYRHGEEWKTTQSLGRDDLPVARLLLGRAWEFILETEAAARSNDQSE